MFLHFLELDRMNGYSIQKFYLSLIHRNQNIQTVVDSSENKECKMIYSIKNFLYQAYLFAVMFLVSQQLLLEKLKSNEPITYNLIWQSLMGIGVPDPNKVITECDGVVKRSWNVIRKRYMHTEEEAALVSIYTYEDDVKSEMSPYKIINKSI